jgi:transposase InsO family protein
MIDHAKDSLWSVDVFRYESILLQTQWVLVVVDQFTRRIIGFGVHMGDVYSLSLCHMFNRVILRRLLLRYLSTENDPLFRFHRWQGNLRVLDIEPVKPVPYSPVSHPFVERLVGTQRWELLDRTKFWNWLDLERMLTSFRKYYNESFVHSSLGGRTPSEMSENRRGKQADIRDYRWDSHFS